MKSPSRERSGRGALYGVTLGAIALGACQFDDAEPALKPEEAAPSMAAAGGAGGTLVVNPSGGTGGSVTTNPSGGTGGSITIEPACNDPAALTDSPFCALNV